MKRQTIPAAHGLASACSTAQQTMQQPAISLANRPASTLANRPRSRRAGQRRGVILLIALMMLALFTLVAISFVLAAAAARRGAAAAAKLDLTGDNPPDLLDQAFAQVVRGSRDLSSSIGPHSLLDDRYGDGQLGEIVIPSTVATFPFAPPTAGTGGQFLTVGIALHYANSSAIQPAPRFDGYFNGRLFTATSGSGRYHTVQIVGYRANDAATGNPLVPPELTVMAPKGFSLRDGDSFVINGRPFAGHGIGFNGATGLMDAKDTDPLLSGISPLPEIALLPNPRYNTSLANHLVGSLPGDEDNVEPNEDYDAPDYQNPFLAARVWIGDSTSGHWEVIEPSFHRPELFRYWANRITGDPLNVAGIPLPLLRKISFRPLGIERATAPTGTDNPNFTGSNIALPTDGYFNPVFGQRDVFADGSADGDGIPNFVWDVDNDGDGRPDSVWIDLGMPVQYAADGHPYKPLFAILCLDMDGKLNLNAHGNLNQLTKPSIQLVAATAGLAGAVPANLSRGLSMGPAEVNLLEGLGDPTSYKQLLWGITHVDGRYGESYRTDLAEGYVGEPGLPGPGTSKAATGSLYRNEIYQANKLFAYPGISGEATGYGTPPDLDGDAIRGIDPRGNPIVNSGGEIGSATTRPEWQDQPYEIDLSSPSTHKQIDLGSGVLTTVDNPYTAEEVEAILRSYDVDSSLLPNRIMTLAPTVFGGDSAAAELRRGIFTSHSFDSPVPHVIPPKDLMEYILKGPDTIAGTGDEILLLGADGVAGSGDEVIHSITQMTIAELLAVRMVKDGGQAADPVALSAKINNLLLPPELLLGMRMSLNRPLGNGVDNNGDGVTDDPREAMEGETFTQLNGAGVASQYPLDFNRNGIVTNTTLGTFDPEDGLCRQLMARHLYVLGMLLKDTGYRHSKDSSLSDAQRDELMAQRIAQWAINVVDFRDPDSAMTPFEYDLKPFDGWDVDGWIGHTPGPDGAWGTRGVDDDGNGIIDDVAEAGMGDDVVSPDDGSTDRRVVWGVERPEVVLSETIALHDNRTGDLDDDDGTPPSKVPPLGTDDDFDQRLKPQGSLFIELYNPRGPLDPVYPAGLYKNGKLNLGALAAASNDGKRRPVWQIAIGVGPAVDGSKAPNDRESLHPQQSDLLDPTKTIDIERIVWFTTPAVYGALPTTTDSKVYYDSLKPFNGTTVDDEENHVDFDTSDAANPDSVKTSEAMFMLAPGQYAVVGPRVLTKLWHTSPAPIKEFRLIDKALSGGAGSAPKAPSTGKLVSDTTNAKYPVIGTQIAEPLGIVINEPQPLNISEPIGGYAFIPDAKSQDPDDPTIEYKDRYSMTHDAPFDPLELRVEGKLPRHKAAYLQRLANPNEPWDAKLNPYITVDWMPIDLTVFNSEPSAQPDPVDPTPAGAKFVSQERSGANMNLWKQKFSDDMATPASHNELLHSLGYLNGFYNNGGAMPKDNYFAASGPPLTTPAAYLGDPPSPWPWLEWNNRPYESAYQVLSVPSASPSRLLSEFGIDTTKSFYSEHTAAGNDPPYAQMLNLFDSSTYLEAAGLHANFQRIMEYVEVPSPYTGTQMMLSQANFQAGTAAPPAPFTAPFNWLSRLRDPGRININTVFDEGTTMQAALNRVNDTGAGYDAIATYKEMIRSRKGYGNDTDATQMNPLLPTIFANPFRSADSYYNGPIDALRFRYKQDLSQGELHRASDAGLLRPRSDPTTGDPLAGTKPLFEFNSPSTQPYNYSEPNPAFKYQNLERLGNVFTTRSNVFAVWITVGYFDVEADPLGPSDVHPDGFRLGGEIGIDTGEVKRHRAFFMYDRSVPVGFRRGENYNMQDGVLVRRFIE